MPAPLLLTDLRAATMLPGGVAYGLIEDAAIAIEGGAIRWAGAARDLPGDLADWPARGMGGRRDRLDGECHAGCG